MCTSCLTAGSRQTSGPWQGQELMWGGKGHNAIRAPNSPKGPLETRAELTHFLTQGKEPAGAMSRTRWRLVSHLSFRIGEPRVSILRPYRLYPVAKDRIPGPHSHSQWLLVSNLADRDGANGASRGGLGGTLVIADVGGVPRCQGRRGTLPSDMRSCLSPWACVSHWRDGSRAVREL